MKLLLICALLAVAVTARPLQWFAGESYYDTAADVPKSLANKVETEWEFPRRSPHMHEMSGATSFLQTTTGGHPLECDCERVKCNCVKRCECGLPPAAQNRQASAFLELASTTGKSTAPLWVDVDTNECFLQTGESVGQDTHHMLDCECDKVKCNCVKHCECSLPPSAAGATAQNDLLQLDQGKGEEAEQDKTAEAETAAAPEPQQDAEEVPQEQAPQPQAQPANEAVKPASRSRRSRSSSRSKGNRPQPQENSGSYYTYSYSYSGSPGSKSYEYSYSQ